MQKNMIKFNGKFTVD